MEQEDLNWQDRLWILTPEKTKNKRGHTVFMTDLFKSIVEPISTKKFVFSKGKTPPSGFSRAKKNIDKHMGDFAKADFEEAPAEWHVHDLRRTCASGMAKLKPRVNLATVELCLNHWSGELGGLREIYIQPDQADDMADAWRRWAEHVAGIVAL
jgi:integrase